jgi:hypothetical protein
LNNGTDAAISIALCLYEVFYIRAESMHKLPEEQSFQLLTHNTLFRKPAKGNRDQMDDYYWTNIARAFFRIYPDKSIEFAETMLQHIGADGTILDGYHSEALNVLNEVAQHFPDKIWEMSTKYLGPPITSTAWHITHWLQEGVLQSIPLEQVWKWVDGNVEKRAWYLASFVPKSMSQVEGHVCLAREVLIRYGHRKDVRNNLMANFSSEMWWGNESDHHKGKRSWLFGLKKNEKNANVILWIDEYAASLEREIKRAEIYEERED